MLSCATTCGKRLYNKLLPISTTLTHPLLFVMRLWMANVFFKSGMVKLNNWQGTVSLFITDYKVPVLPPELAAYIATFFEISCPIALVLGVATRLACLPLLAMTAMIKFIYPNDLQAHYRTLLLLAILLFGPGKIAVDNWLKKRLG